MTVLLDKIEAQKNRLSELAKEKPAFVTWIKQLTEMEEVVLKAEGVLKLKRDPVFKEIIAKFEKTINDINHRLKTERNMSEEERQLLFIQKDFNQTFIDIFGAPSKVLKSVEKRIGDAAKNLKTHGYN